ncbi:hypothetical protein SRB5_37850 [Streptomyces sp. RB5]|uniref:HTH cro/C1-type domain-containing protein n=1 Tax=Streptomyces smaragdinus TaxID=2585196 RepID=A0A7K0CJH6_9ACTN|nr:helix-turn-helix transcriptional regulator [Streptomyces smaragdinus]MQY13635.1 hypothetical protein [Streptomyces smaragdinus]
MSDDLGGFLRSRRARIRPDDVGLPAYGRRRVPGLRREEVAQLAGVSVDYYIRLEQGRGPSVSDAVLDAVARVLRLDAVEREHLYDLARPGRARRFPAEGPDVRPGLRALLDSLGTPAFVLGRRMEVVAWNGAGDAVNGFASWVPVYGTVVRHTFRAPGARELYPEWETVAREAVGYLRLDAGRHPGDAETEALVGELSAADADFRRLWAAHDVREKAHGRKLLRHPVLGELEFGYETLTLPGDPDLLLVAYTAARGSATEGKLAEVLPPATVAT